MKENDRRPVAIVPPAPSLVKADRLPFTRSHSRHAGHLAVGDAQCNRYAGAMARMTVNGEPIHYKLEPATPLLWALRDASNLTGTKYGCDSGHCGACTVIVDGRAALSCTLPIGELEGAQITTIEGLGRAHGAQQAWLAEQVTMCGACEPGFIMAIAALLGANSDPDEAAVAALPNLCRCGAYPRIRKATASAAKVERTEAKRFSKPQADPAQTLPQSDER